MREGVQAPPGYRWPPRTCPDKGAGIRTLGQALPRLCPASTSRGSTPRGGGGAGAWGLRGSSVNTLMGLRERGGMWAPRCLGTRGGMGVEGIRLCRYAGRRGSGKDGKDGRTRRSGAAWKGGRHRQPRCISRWSGAAASLVPPSRKPCPARWDKGHETGVSRPALLSPVGPGAWLGTSLSLSFLTPETGVRVLLHPEGCHRG